MLLWEGGLIKVEITCRGKKNCHQGPIMQILLDEGELMTIGVDGYIRVSLYFFYQYLKKARAFIINFILILYLEPAMTCNFV